MEKEPEILKIGETYESKPDGTLVYKSPILSKDTREVVGIEETAINRMVVATERQADKKEQTIVKVGNRTINDAVTTQKEANGFSFTG